MEGMEKRCRAAHYNCDPDKTEYEGIYVVFEKHLYFQKTHGRPMREHEQGRNIKELSRSQRPQPAIGQLSYCCYSLNTNG